MSSLAPVSEGAGRAGGGRVPRSIGGHAERHAASVEEQREGKLHLSLDLPRARTCGSSVSANTPLLDDSERERENTPSPEVPLHAPSRLCANSEAGSSVEDPLMENQGE